MLVQALAACAAMRPPVDISVGGDNSSEGVGVGGARTELIMLESWQLTQASIFHTLTQQTNLPTVYASLT